MIRVAANFRDRDGLLQSQQGIADGILFVPEYAEGSVGSSLLVHVAAQGLVAGLFIEGVVAWRRVQSTGTFAKGTGVRVLSTHIERLNFLLRWARGDVPSAHRGHPRFPCTERVLVSFAGTARRSTQRLVHGTLEDVSERGALLVTPSPLVGASELLIDMHDAGRTPFHARVVWTAGNRSGLVIGPTPHEGERGWSTLVERVARSVDPEVRIER